MAIPRVFISSTCYDLSEVRDSLVSFINSYGFEDALSERGDVFYHPDLNTHDACIKEISTCHLLILIIGGRFGGGYTADTSKSIVNAEYEAARESNIPVFTFVKKDVLHDHNLYEKNKNNKEIIYPSIEKNDFAASIFEFINSVRKSPTNNGFFEFQFSREIESNLKKQWAGMFHGFLLDRVNKGRLDSANQTLSQLNSMSSKIETLVENIYRKVEEDKGIADSVIGNIDRNTEARSLLSRIENNARLSFASSNCEKLLTSPLDDKWFEWLDRLEDFEILSGSVIDGRVCDIISCTPTDRVIGVFAGELDVEERKENEIFEKGYEAYKSLKPEERREVIQEIVMPFV